MQFFEREKPTELESAKQFAKNCRIARQKVGKIIRQMTRDRTDVGRKAALARGVQFGRPAKMTEEQLKLARKLLKQGKSIRYTADVFGVHFTTLYRYLR